MLKESFELVFENCMELLCLRVLSVLFAKLLNARYEEFKLLQDLLQNLDVLIVDRLVQKIIKAETASNHQHQTLVKLGCDFEKHFVIILQLQAVIFKIINHPHLLLVEKLPDLEYVLKVVSSNLVEMTFESA